MRCSTARISLLWISTYALQFAIICNLYDYNYNSKQKQGYFSAYKAAAADRLPTLTARLIRWLIRRCTYFCLLLCLPQLLAGVKSKSRDLNCLVLIRNAFDVHLWAKLRWIHFFLSFFQRKRKSTSYELMTKYFVIVYIRSCCVSCSHLCGN